MTEAASRWSEWRRPIPPRELWLLVFQLVGAVGLYAGSRAAVDVWQLAGVARVAALVALWVAGYAISVVVHELGHALVAMATRHHVVQFTAGPVQAKRMRRGWRVRMAPAGLRPAASVGAFPRLGTGSTRAWLACVIAGPMANGVLAALAVTWALSFVGTAGASWAWGLACMSLFACGVSALLPSMHEAIPSDGDLIRGAIANSPRYLMDLHVGRWLGAMIDGRRAADAPAAELEAIRGVDPVGGALFVASARLEVALEAGDWRAAVAVADEVDALLAEAPEADAIRAQAPMFLLECALARTLASGDSAPLQDAISALSFAVLAHAEWDVPWIFPRAVAVLEFLRGDDVAARAALAESARHADATVYASVRATEAGVRAQIERWAASRMA